METIKFYTLGCKVNQYDTQNIREQFIRAGFKELDNHKPADIYIINTCTVTHRADSESLTFMRRAKRENPRGFVVVTGCLTELDSDRIKEIGGINLIVKNSNKDKIINFFNRQTGKQDNGITNFKGHTRAFLKIQDGCDNFCSYCKVSLVRGPSRSRPQDEIIAEATRLVDNGFKEIVLCGICLGSYGKDLREKITLVDIIKKLEGIDGLLRIRLSSIEAGDVSGQLLDKMAQSKKLCRHLHIPIQSGDDEILEKMNRRYTFKSYLSLIWRIKARIPEVSITTDIMVGFPSETEGNFQNTIRLIKEIIPLKVHIFPYSLRNGTVASNFREALNPDVVKERISRMKDICENCSLIYKKQFLNKKMDVLVEGRAKENPIFWEGRIDNYLKVWIESGRDLKNQLIPVKLKKIVKSLVLADFC